MPTERPRKGTNLDDVQEMNRSLILHLLRQMQVCSRAELAKASGLRQSTVTNIIRDLMARHLVVETGLTKGRKGRRSIGLRLNTETHTVIGARITRQFVSVGVFDLDGTLRRCERMPIEISSGPEAALTILKQLIAGLLDSHVIGLGVAAPGPIIKSQGRIAIMTQFPGWESVPLQAELTSTFGLPTRVEHDARAAAAAEWLFGNVPKSGTLVYLAVGQGVGAGIVVDGVLQRGDLGTAGEVGHMSVAYDGPRCDCGNRGCLDLYASTTALVREVRRNLPSRPDSMLASASAITFDSVLQAYRMGDRLARDEFDKVGWYLGFGLVNVVNLLNPSYVIIGDEMAQAGLPLLQHVQEVVNRHVVAEIAAHVQIRLSRFTDDPALVGASALVVNELLKRPSIIGVRSANQTI